MRHAHADPGEFWIDPPPSLDEALLLVPDPADLTARLARALGQAEVSRSKRPDGNVTYSGELPGRRGGIELLLTPTNELRGVGLEEMKKVYAVVVAIESELSTAMYFGPEERGRRVEAVCRRLNISRADFNNILGHWTKF